LAGFSSTARLRVWNESGGRWLWRKQEDILLGPERTTHTLLGWSAGWPARAGGRGAEASPGLFVSGARSYLATKLVFRTGSQEAFRGFGGWLGVKWWCGGGGLVVV